MMKEDFSVFFNTNEFAEELTYSPLGGISRSVVGIFDRQYYESHDSTAGISSSSPTLLLPESEVPEISYGDQFIRNFETFKARQFEPDGTGLISIVLESA